MSVVDGVKDDASGTTERGDQDVIDARAAAASFELRRCYCEIGGR